MPGFLSAMWRHLVVVTYRVSPDVLEPLLPDGVDLDLWDGKSLVSVLGVTMTDVRIRGVPVPCHRQFPEINFRCYARRRDGAPGVVFLKEIVPRRAVALMARLAFNEKFVSGPMRQNVERHDGETRLTYEWEHGGERHSLRATVAGVPREITPGSLEEFILERRLGFVERRDGRLLTYEIARDRWRWWRANTAEVDADPASLYGEEFRGLFDDPPFSAVVAEGSAIIVRKTDE